MDTTKLDEIRNKIKESSDFIRSKINIKPEISIILGTGLGKLAEEVEKKVVIPYKDIPNFPISTAPTHAGNLIIGEISGKKVMVMQGRFHSYEGYTQKQITFPIRVMKSLGVHTLINTCATGGLNRHFNSGDLMLISDHINLTGSNPLIGLNDPELGPRFPVMFNAYDPELRKLAHKVALDNNIRLQEGVYAGISGPVFLTASELRSIMLLGADSIGMSIVPEVIVARHSNLRVLGIASITDIAIPDYGHHADETEILNTAKQSEEKFCKLLKNILKEI